MNILAVLSVHDFDQGSFKGYFYLAARAKSFRKGQGSAPKSREQRSIMVDE
jgi:hypothetical protein